MYRVPVGACRRLRGFAAGLAAGAVLLIATIDGAQASGRAASFIIDVNSGRTLHASNADAIRHPASLTKIMTLYLLFEKLDAGEITLNSRMPVSAKAAAEVPTKLGLKPGSTIRVEDAIHALIVRSANDVATVVAEFVGGSEAGFARMMTTKARQLGMPRTIYHNAHGLPNSAQVTTAREQAVLGIAIQQRFPRYFKYFSTRSFQFAGRTLRSHNRLLGTVPGVNGIKTGYTRASGFNLVTSLRRGDRQIVGVVLGGTTGAARDARMRSLVEGNIMQASVRRTAPPVIAAAAAAIPVPAPVPRIGAVAELPAPLMRPEPATDTEASVAVAAFAPTKPAALPLARPLAKPAEPAVATRPAGPAVAAKPAQPAATAKPAGRTQLASAGDMPVQLESGAALQAPRLGSTDPIEPIIVRAIPVGPAAVARAQARPASAQRTDAARRTAMQTASAAPVSVPQTSQVQPPQGQPSPEEPRTVDAPPNASEAVASLPAEEAVAANEVVTVAGSDAEASAETTGSRSANKPDAPAGETSPRSGWAIQVGAFVAENDARERLDEARTKAAGRLKKADPYTERTDRGSRTYYRARFAGFEERGEAEEACRELKRNSIQCLALRI